MSCQVHSFVMDTLRVLILANWEHSTKFYTVFTIIIPTPLPCYSLVLMQVMCLSLCWCTFTFNNSCNCLKISLPWASTIEVFPTPRLYKCSFQFEICSHITTVVLGQFPYVRPNWIATQTNLHTLWRIGTCEEPAISPKQGSPPYLFPWRTV